MKKILIFWFLAIGMANAQIRIGTINGDTTTRTTEGLAALAWNNNNLYVVKPTGNTVKFLQNDSRLWVGDNDRVGVGTKTPSQPFEVAGNAKIGGSLQIGVGAGIIRSDANGLLSSGTIPVNDVPYLGGLYLPLLGGGNINGNITANNLSGTNTGDNAVNSLYSGLAASKFDVNNTVFTSPLRLDQLLVPVILPGLPTTSVLKNVATISQATTSQNGFLTSTDWNNFNSKLSTTTAANTYAPINNPTFTGSVNITGLLGNGGSLTAGSLFINDIKILSQVEPIVAGRILTTDANGNGTWQQNKAVTNLSFIGSNFSWTENGIGKLSPSLLTFETATNNYAPINNPTFTGTVGGITKSTVGLGNVDNTSDADKPISTATQTALNEKSGLSFNNNFIGSNLFLTPIFANSTSTSSFSSVTGAWSNTGNLGIFSLRYNTKVGSNTLTWNPVRLDGNGWVGIGIDPTQAFEVLGAAKFNSAITATSIAASGAVSALSYSSTTGANFATSSGNVGIGTASPSEKLDIIGRLKASLDAIINGLTIGKGGGNISTNVAFGVSALANNTTGSNNLAIGSNSLTANTTGFSNLAIGNNSLNTITTGSKNIAIGENAGSAITTGLYNVLIGGNSGSRIASSNYNMIFSDGLGSERFCVNNLGDMGIGTTSPVAKLSISTPLSSNAALSMNNGDAVNSFTAPQIQFSFANTNTYSHFIHTRHNTTSVGNAMDFYISNGTSNSTLTSGTVNVLTLTPTGVGIGTSSPNAPLQFAQTTANRKIVMYEETNNDHQFYGLGVNPFIQRYQVPTAAHSHVFYAGTSATTSVQLFSIKGNGSISHQNLTTTQVNAITGMAAGDMVYNSTLNLFCFYNGTAWRRMDGSAM